MFGPLADLLTGIWPGFSQWLAALTLWDFLLIFWPLIVIDAVRSLGKSAVLLGNWLRQRFANPRELTEYPLVSLIIPAHNEERAIEASINAALESTYPNKEVIVVDDGSKDKTREIAQPYADRGQIKLIHRDDASGSKSGALNYG